MNAYCFLFSHPEEVNGFDFCSFQSVPCKCLMKLTFLNVIRNSIESNGINLGKFAFIRMDALNIIVQIISKKVSILNMAYDRTYYCLNTSNVWRYNLVHQENI